MTDIDYAGLREKAEKATRGPWRAETRKYGSEVGDYYASHIPGVVDALARLAAWHDEMQRFEQTGRLYQGPCWCSSCAAAELEKGDDR